METSHLLDGIVNKMLLTLFVKQRLNKILKTLLESWLMLERGNSSYIQTSKLNVDNEYRVDIKMT